MYASADGGTYTFKRRPARRQANGLPGSGPRRRWVGKRGTVASSGRRDAAGLEGAAHLDGVAQARDQRLGLVNAEVRGDAGG